MEKFFFLFLSLLLAYLLLPYSSHIYELLVRPSFPEFIIIPVVISLIALFVFLFLKKNPKKITCKIGNLEWDRNSFCRGWLITGATGVGKTVAGINYLMNQLFQNESGSKDMHNLYQSFPWGGLCIDEKGTYLSTLENMAKRYARENDLCVLKSESILGNHRPAHLGHRFHKRATQPHHPYISLFQVNCVHLRQNCYAGSS